MRKYQEYPHHLASLQIFQVNVGCGGEVHDITLNLGFQEDAEVIALQELWVFPDLAWQTTKRYPRYEVFCPNNTWLE